MITLKKSIYYQDTVNSILLIFSVVHAHRMIWLVGSGFNENTKDGKWSWVQEEINKWLPMPWITCYYTYTPRLSHTWQLLWSLWRRDSDWIKTVRSYYPQTEYISTFVFAGVINSTQEATRHRSMGWQTDPWAINKRGWKNYSQPADLVRERR